MPEPTQDPIVARLNQVERSLQSLTQRLNAVEQLIPSPRVAAPQAATVIPPPYVNPTPIHPWMRSTQEEIARLNAPVGVEERPALDPDDLEYKIGRTGLLTGGAVVVVIAMIYLVGLSVARGYITPSVQFVGEILLCVGFIALGFVKRNEREDFGQLMTGIGSCGLYLSFAGGNIFKHLYPGEMLVTLFVALSFANFAYAWWRSSKSFLAIGMIGGLTAAMMPMHRFNPTLDVVLHFLILVPSVAIVMKNRWMDMSVVLWLASTAALIPALTYNAEWGVRIGALYGSSLICAATYAAVWRETDLDPNCSLPPIILGLGAVLALLFDDLRHGSLHILIMSIAGGALGFAFRKNVIARQSLWMGSIALAVTVTPIGYHRLEATFIFGILSVCLALGSIKFAPRGLTVLSGITLALALTGYVAPWTDASTHWSVATETGILVLLMGATAASGFACYRAGALSESMTLISAVVLFPLFSRLGFVLLTAPGIHVLGALAFLISSLIFAFAAVTTGTVNRWMSMVLLGWFGFVCAIWAYLSMSFDAVNSLRADSTILLGLLGFALYIGQAHIRQASKDGAAVVVATSGFAVWALLVRLIFIWLTMSAVRMHDGPAVEIGILIAGTLSAGLALRPKLTALIPQSWAAIAIASAGFLLTELVRGSSLSLELSKLAVAFGAVLLITKATSRVTSERAALTTACVGFTWALFSRFAWLVFTSFHIGLTPDAATTGSWIVYAVALIALGFIYEARNLRYWSLAIFAATIGKVFIYDLSGLDPAVRVGILMALGLGMIGAGYWYVRRRARRTKQSSAGKGYGEAV